MKPTLGISVVLASLLLLSPVVRGAQGQQTVVEGLFAKLCSPSTTDDAAKSLLKLGRSDPQARAYLNSRIPSIILRGPKGREVWANAVRLAGQLRLPGACPALAKWMNHPWGQGSISLGQAVRLEDKPAAKALAQIGDPAIPSIVQVLKHGNESERWEAIFVLDGIHSAAAKKALAEREPAEHNRELRALIHRILGSWGRVRAGSV